MGICMYVKVHGTESSRNGHCHGRPVYVYMYVWVCVCVCVCIIHMCSESSIFSKSQFHCRSVHVYTCIDIWIGACVHE